MCRMKIPEALNERLQRQKKFYFKGFGVIFFTEGGGYGEESDVLSINADAYDSDIEAPKEEQTVKAVKVACGSRESADPIVNPGPPNPEPPTAPRTTEAKKDIQSDIDKSVCEILAFSSTSSKEEAKEQSAPPQPTDVCLPAEGASVSSRTPSVCQPSIQQLELLELEMRARAIKALMKASDKTEAPILSF